VISPPHFGQWQWPATLFFAKGVAWFMGGQNHSQEANHPHFGLRVGLATPRAKNSNLLLFFFFFFFFFFTLRAKALGDGQTTFILLIGGSRTTSKGYGGGSATPNRPWSYLSHPFGQNGGGYIYLFIFLFSLIFKLF
jgi:hypothetical protein